jgi:ABC-type antimicrobial peptide transport system permease subunit
VKQDDLADLRTHGAAYFPIAVPPEFPAPSEFMVTIRTRQAPEAAGTALRAAVLHIDPNLPLYDVKSMAMRVNGSLSSRRIPLLLAGIFAAASLVLAAVGIYGVLAYTVAQRRREIGVRMALGAQPGRVLRQFLGLGLRLLAISLPLGLIGAWSVGRAMAGLLFGIGPANPLVLGGTAAILAAVALLACLLPARRAAGVAPSEALRAD